MSCVKQNRKDACCLGRLVVILMNLLDGSDGSIVYTCSALGDSLNMILFSTFIQVWSSCLAADLLHGNILMWLDLVHSCLGSVSGSEVSPDMAFLASLLVASFPDIPEWPRDHLIESLHKQWYLRATHRLLWKMSMR